MNSIAEVTNLSSSATKKDVENHFSCCGDVLNVEIIRFGEHDNRAYVKFGNRYALDLATSEILTGLLICGEPVKITPYGQYDDVHEDAFVYMHGQYDDMQGGDMHTDAFVSIPTAATVVAGAATVMAATTMVRQGYVLSQDARQRSKAFDDAYQLSMRAASTVGHAGITIAKKSALLLSSVLDYAAKSAADFGSR